MEQSVRGNGCCSKLSESDKYLLVDLVLSNPGIYLRELQPELGSKFVDVSTICCVIKKMGLSHQKISSVLL